MPKPGIVYFRWPSEIRWKEIFKNGILRWLTDHALTSSSNPSPKQNFTQISNLLPLYQLSLNYTFLTFHMDI